MKRQVKRNIERFPDDFMFELSQEEYASLRCQNGTIEIGRGQHSKYPPLVFTEQFKLDFQSQVTRPAKKTL